MTDKFKFTFELQQFSPDRRKFKPSTPVLVPNNPVLLVAVDVPANAEYIYNNAEHLSLVLTNSTEPFFPILTPRGLRYIIDQFESVMDEPEPEIVDDFDDEADVVSKVAAKVSEDDDWDTVPTTTNPPTKALAEDERW
jgi:hypothetical protein